MHRRKNQLSTKARVYQSGMHERPSCISVEKVDIDAPHERGIKFWGEYGVSVEAAFSKTGDNRRPKVQNSRRSQPNFA